MYQACIREYGYRITRQYTRKIHGIIYVLYDDELYDELYTNYMDSFHGTMVRLWNIY